MRFYDIGIFFSISGLFYSLNLLFSFSHSSLQKRNVTPIIPGVTVPLSHTPLIVLAVLLNQAGHEAGHAIAASLSSISITSYSLFLPFSSVSLPPIREPLTRLRIASAGPFHNAILFLALSALVRTPIPAIFASIAYQDISHHAVVVLDVDSDSPLVDHIPPGTLITKLDDTAGVWQEYLLASPESPTSGWCVPSFNDLPAECCTALTPSPSCFRALDFRMACTDPISLLTLSSTSRCTHDTDCAPDARCAIPAAPETLLRITVQVEDLEHVMLWNGPREEILDQVTIDTLVPRLSILPTHLPHLTRLTTSYLTLAALSLFLFNLLPLPLLDGSHVLTAALELVLPDDDGEMDALEMGLPTRRSRSRSPARWDNHPRVLHAIRNVFRSARAKVSRAAARVGGARRVRRALGTGVQGVTSVMAVLRVGLWAVAAVRGD